MKTYKDQAEALYNRVEKKYGPKPTQENIREYLGPKYFGTEAQDNFIGLITTVSPVGGYTTKDGKEIKGYTKTSVKWNIDEEEEILKLYDKYGKGEAKTQIEYLKQVMKGRHTRQAIVKKRRRLLNRKR